jgi:hypothetical protein
MHLIIVIIKQMHMKEHPDYKYKPRRKPKHLMKKGEDWVLFKLF